MMILIFLLAMTAVSSLPVDTTPTAPTSKFNDTALQGFLDIAQNLQDGVRSKDGLIPCWYYRSWKGEAYLTEPLFKYCLYVLGNDKKSYYLEGFAPDEDEQEEKQHVDLAFAKPGLLYTQFSLIHNISMESGFDVQMHKFYCRTPACNIPSNIRMYSAFQRKFHQLNK